MNIIILTIGRTGSTILTRMLGELGWNLPVDADEYAEPVALREINERLIRGLPVASEEMQAAIDMHEQPCVLKDPRFAWTLKEWRDHFQGACLIWLTRDLAMVELSLRKQGWGRSSPGGYRLGGETLPTIEEWCGNFFQEWQGPKIKLAYEQLKSAVSLFDLSRG